MVTRRRPLLLRIPGALGQAVCILLLAVPAGAAEKMRFRYVGTGGNCWACSWIQADGEITQDTPADFARFVQEAAKSGSGIGGSLVALNSPGGNVSAAVDLGEALRKQGIVTAVAATVPQTDAPDGSGEKQFTLQAGQCASACFFAFVGGSHRAYQPRNAVHPVTGSTLGVHRFAPDIGTESVASAQQISGMLSSFLSRMGVDPAILALAASVPDGQMHTLTPAEAARFHVINMGLPPADWALQRTADGRALVASLTGTVETDESEFEQYRYQAVLSCRRADAGRLRLAIEIRGDTPFPAGNGYDQDIPGHFTFGLRWRAGDTVYLGSAATNADPESTLAAFSHGQDTDGTPEPTGAFDLSLADSALHDHDNQMVLAFTLGPQSVTVIDRIDPVWLVTEGRSHADESWLPREIPLPWPQRANISSLLRNNCATDGDG